MPRAFALFGFCVVGGALLACGQGAVSAPEAPARDIETRILPPKPHREIPRLIAPPPAYGNKIVMARGAAIESAN